MIKGIGTDIVQVSRFNRKDIGSWKNRIFTENEWNYSFSHADPYPHLAGIWAAKESFIKASGKKETELKSIEILHEESGKPFIEIKSEGAIHLSISHEKEYATAIVIIEN